MIVAVGDLAVPGPGLGGLVATVLVLAALVGAAWLVRRGTLGASLGRKGRQLGFSVETAFPLGERRSLAVVTVEGRRLLLGLTPANISLITELPRGDQGQSFGATLDRRSAEGDR